MHLHGRTKRHSLDRLSWVTTVKQWAVSGRVRTMLNWGTAYGSIIVNVDRCMRIRVYDGRKVVVAQGVYNVDIQKLPLHWFTPKAIQSICGNVESLVPYQRQIRVTCTDMMGKKPPRVHVLGH